jgi:hypothetical protein
MMREPVLTRPEEYSTLHQELIADIKIKKIETEQSEGIFGIVQSQGTAKRKAGGP